MDIGPLIVLNNAFHPSILNSVLLVFLMSLPKPYLYKKSSSRIPRTDVNRVEPIKDDEELTGWVHGNVASAIEERFARALDKKKIEYHFQVDIPTAAQLEDKSLDFLVIYGIGFPIEVDGDIGHKTERQKAKDAVKEAYINEWARFRGYVNLIRVPGYELETQELADLKVAVLFG